MAQFVGLGGKKNIFLQYIFPPKGANNSALDYTETYSGSGMKSKMSHVCWESVDLCVWLFFPSVERSGVWRGNRLRCGDFTCWAVGRHAEHISPSRPRSLEHADMLYAEDRSKRRPAEPNTHTHTHPGCSADGELESALVPEMV